MKIFETFAGIGAQHKALRNLKKKNIIKGFEVLGISEWYISAIIAYTKIHHLEEFNKRLKQNERIDKNEILKELEDYTFSTNSKDPIHNKKIKEKTLRELYTAVQISNNLGSVLDLQSEELPNNIDVLTYSFPCFVKGTLILTDNGYKNIEDIQKDDKVLTHNNQYKKVIKPMVNHTNHIYELNSMSSEKLLVTEEHPFYVRKRNKIWNSNNNNYNNYYYYEEPKWVKTKDLSKKHYLGMAINQKSQLPIWHGIKDDIKENNLKKLFLDKNFWWVIGLFIGNGKINIKNNSYKTILYSSYKPTLYSFYKNNRDKLLEKKLEKLNINFSKSKDKYALKYTIHSKELTIFLSQFGNFETEKKLTNTIIDLPKKLLKKVIKGYLFSKGYFKKNKEKKFILSSDSKELTYGLGQCIAKAYNKPYKIVNKENVYYQLIFKLIKSKSNKAFFENNYIWFPVENIKKQNYNGKVYNFEVEKDNSYTVNNIIVHNCQDLSNAGKKKGLGQGTRSGLLWEIGRILEGKREIDRPNVLLMENVPTLFNKFKDGWQDWKEQLTKYGYESFDVILSSNDFNIPQIRRRAFSIAIKTNSNNINLEYFDILKNNGLEIEVFKTNTFNNFKKEINNNGTPKIKDILDNINDIEHRYYIHKPFNILKSTDGKTGAKFDLIDHSTYEIANRVYDINFCSPTLTTSGIIKIFDENKKLRNIKEIEAFQLMGFEKEDYNKIKNDFTKGHLYRFAGNSIVVNVLEGLFEVINKIII